MKNILLFTILILILFSACKKSEKKESLLIIQDKNQLQQLETIKTIEFNRFNSAKPINFDLHKYIATKIDMDSVYLIQFTYKKDSLIHSKVLKSYENSENNRILFLKISRKFLKENQIFGYLEGLDEEGLNINFELNGEKNIFWKLGPRENEYPKEIQSFYEMYIELQQKFDKMK